MFSGLGMTLKAESPCSFHRVDVDHEVWMLEADEVLRPSTGWPCHCPYYPTWPSVSHWSSSSWDYQWSRGDNSTAIIPLPSILFPPLTLAHLFQSLSLFLKGTGNLYIINSEKKKPDQLSTLNYTAEETYLEKSVLCKSVTFVQP